MTKEAAILMARREANRSGATMVLLNLNPFSPLYVVRAWNAAFDGRKELVYVAHPETIDQGG